jgi:hypothetical protein
MLLRSPMRSASSDSPSRAALAVARMRLLSLLVCRIE